MRKVPLVEGDYYHIFNRGVDKRQIFVDQDDFQRFLKSMKLFNSTKTIGSIFEYSFAEKQPGHSVSGLDKSEPLVEFVAYCLNENHYHFILKQICEKGIEKFMHKLGMGYAKYFNEKYQRSGALFQGPFKTVWVDSNEQLLHLSAYVNLNWKVHQLGHGVSKSSWEEYVGDPRLVLCKKDIILGQFDSVSLYEKFAERSIEDTKRRRGILDSEILID